MTSTAGLNVFPSKDLESKIEDMEELIWLGFDKVEANVYGKDIPGKGYLVDYVYTVRRILLEQCYGD